MVAYKIKSDLSTADVAFEVKAKTLSQLFAEAAKALTEIQLKKKTQPDRKKIFRLNEKELLDLFYQFLSQLILLKDRELFFGYDFKTEVFQENSQWILKAEVLGRTHRQDPEAFGTDIKAMTYHNLNIEKKAGFWQASVIVDV